MNYRRGEVVLAYYPFASGSGGTRRPVLIVQNDADNVRMSNTIVAQITSNTTRAQLSTQLLVEVAIPEGRQSGLLRDSVVSCNKLATLDASRLGQVIGSLPASLMSLVDACLMAALDLP